MHTARNHRGFELFEHAHDTETPSRQLNTASVGQVEKGATKEYAQGTEGRRLFYTNILVTYFTVPITQFTVQVRTSR